MSTSDSNSSAADQAEHQDAAGQAEGAVASSNSAEQEQQAPTARWHRWFKAVADAVHVLRNSANSALQAQRQSGQKKSTRSSNESVSDAKEATQSDRQRHMALADQLMSEWTDSDVPTLGSDGILFLVLLSLALIACPILSLIKWLSATHKIAFSGPVMLKYYWLFAANIVSITAGLAMLLYATLTTFLRTVFPVLETQRLSYSEYLLSRMHCTTGGRLAYNLISQHQYMKRKFD